VSESSLTFFVLEWLVVHGRDSVFQWKSVSAHPYRNFLVELAYTHWGRDSAYWLDTFFSRRHMLQTSD
jgi:hypothetical protein